MLVLFALLHSRVLVPHALVLVVLTQVCAGATGRIGAVGRVGVWRGEGRVGARAGAGAAAWCRMGKSQTAPETKASEPEKQKPNEPRKRKQASPTDKAKRAERVRFSH